MAKDKLNGGNGKQYSVDVGEPQKRLYLGHDEAEAQRRKAKLLEFWEFYKTTEGTSRWDDFALAIAHAIRQGKPTITVDPGGAPHEFDYRLKIDDVNRRYAGFITLVPTDHHAYDALDRFREDWQQAKGVLAEVRKAGGGDRPVVETLDGFKAYTLETMVDVETKQPTEWAVKIGDMCDFLKRHVPEGMTLRHWNYAALNTFCVKLANRPNSVKYGKPISPKYASSLLKIVRTWVKWTSKNYQWKRPEDWLEACAHRPKVSGEEKAEIKGRPAKVTYNWTEVRTLYRYSIKSERAYLLLALNCGFGAKEIATLRRGELHRQGDDVFIRRVRWKSGIYGEWQLWPETVKALEAVRVAGSTYALARSNGGCLIRKTPAGRSNKIAAAWDRLTRRIRKDHPTFRKLSFNKLRKTAARAIRRLSSGETASLFIAHGQTTPDELLEVYAAPDFGPVFEAQRKLRQDIESIFANTETTDARTSIPIGRIDRIRQLWRAGNKAEEIVRQTGASKATVYRYRPARTEAKA